MKKFVKKDKLTAGQQALVIGLAKAAMILPPEILITALYAAVDRAEFGNSPNGHAVTGDEQVHVAKRAIDLLRKVGDTHTENKAEEADKKSMDGQRAEEIMNAAIARAIRASKEAKDARAPMENSVPPKPVDPSSIN